ncbi:MAG: redoxin domain-containing protein, partial [Pirellulales bacterium]
SCDTPEKNKAFAESLNLDYAILSDPGKRVARAYGVVNSNRPVPFRWTYYIGKNGKIVLIDKTVNVQTHGRDVVKKLQELGIKRKE